MVDYYKVLNIQRSATKNEIKKAYYKLAKEWHPDKHKGDDKEVAEEKFKKISEAHQVLSNEESRDVYDKHGYEGLKQHFQSRGATGEGFGMPDIFSQFFGGGFRSPFTQEQQHVHHRLTVPLEYFYTGKTVDFKIFIDQECDTCNGRGCKNVSDIQKCSKCNGHGIIVETINMGPGMMGRRQMPCGACAGKGETIKSGSECNTCNGRKKIKKARTIKFYIKPGSDYGDTIVVDGDIKIKVSLVPDNKKTLFERRDHHLYYQHTITLAQALLGFSDTIPYFSKEKNLVIKSRKIIQPGSVKILPGWGMPKRDRLGVYGDLYICFNIKFPEKISDTQLATLKTIFQAPENQLKDDGLVLDDLQTIQSSVNIPVELDNQPQDQEEHGVNCSQQ